MDVIYNSASAVINWFVYHGANKQTEDFSLLAPESVKAVIIGPANRHCCHMNHNDVLDDEREYEALMTAETDAETGEHYLRIEIEDGVLEEGIYDIKLYWTKDRVAYDPHVGNYPRCETYVKGIFSVIDNESHTTVDFEKTIRSNVEYKPYDGLSAYEIAVLHGYSNSESTWVEKYEDAERRVDDLVDTDGAWGSKFDPTNTSSWAWKFGNSLGSWANKFDTTSGEWGSKFRTTNSAGWAWQFEATNEGSWAQMVNSWSGYESTRQSNESARQSNESARQTAEQNRESTFNNTWAPKFNPETSGSWAADMADWAENFDETETNSWAWKFDHTKTGSWAYKFIGWEDKFTGSNEDSWVRLFDERIQGSWAYKMADWANNFNLNVEDSWAWKFAGWEAKLDTNGDWDVHFQEETEGSWAWQFTESEGTGANPDSWLKQFNDAITDASTATTAANTAAAAADAAREAIEDDLAAKANTDDLLDGTLVPSLADNLKSWAERSSVEVADEWDAVPVRTTAGNLSVNTAENAHIISVKSLGDFTASGFKASPFNLIIASQLVGGVPYILVPACTFGTFGTADENNGLLVTSTAGANKQVSMRFKAYSQGVPTSVNDGVVCPYEDHNGYRFYLPVGAGYVWASDMSTSDCLHMAWSKDYDKYEAASAFASISFTTIINKFTSIGGAHHMLAVRKGGDIVQDSFEYYNSKFNYVKNCGYDATEWTTTAITDEGGETVGYHHEKAISAMALDGACEDYAGMIDINVNGKTIWYDDNSQTASVAVKYELETPVTGTVSVGNTYQPNDMGLEYIEGMAGNATIVTTYMQGLPDELAALPSKVAGIKADVERELAKLGATTDGLAEIIDKLITARLMVALDLEKHYLYRGKPLRTYGIGYHTIKPTFETAATISFSYKVNNYSFAFDVELTADDTVDTFMGKFKAAFTASLSYLGITPSVILLDDGSGIQISTDTDIEVEINTVACTGATFAEVSDHPTTAPAFIGQLYHNTNKKKEWEGKSVLSASDWVSKY